MRQGLALDKGYMAQQLLLLAGVPDDCQGGCDQAEGHPRAAGIRRAAAFPWGAGGIERAHPETQEVWMLLSCLLAVLGMDQGMP